MINLSIQVILLSFLICMVMSTGASAKPIPQEEDVYAHPDGYSLNVEGDDIFSDETDYSLLADSSSAEEELASGNLGDNITWVLYKNGLLSLTGNGEMVTDARDDSNNLDTDKIPWYTYRSMITEISVGDGITSIGDAAFYNCRNLSKITLPDTLTEIGSWGFANCISMTGIKLPTGIRTFKTACFSESGLKEITFPEGVTEIGEYICQKCTSLKKVSLPDSLEVIHKGAFTGCSSLSGLFVFPDNLTCIEDY
ncbi:MAG: leucine-rich repeat domain-containing protein, partial [Eubacterium sp.]|nr:leucine-rich repeat domain-containing protein [Eubacterium sp.]